MKLWYKQPAEAFEEALPVGNGRLGAMIYGGVKTEKLSLNEDTFWSGYPEDKSDKKVQEHLSPTRKLIAEGKRKEAQEKIWKNMLTTWTDSYQPVGNLMLSMNDVEDASTTEYRRELNLDSAVGTTSYKVGNITYKREVFCSHPANVLCVRISSDSKDGISLDIAFESEHPVGFMVKESEDTLLPVSSYLMYGKAPVHVAPNYHEEENPIYYEENGQCGLSFAAAVLPIVKNGGLDISAEGLKITNADEVVLIVNVATNFEDFKTAPKDCTKDEVKACLTPLYQAAKQEFELLLEEHVMDYQNLYKRVVLELKGESYEQMPTDERLKKYVTDQSDISLATLLFQYGRYLLISSSRAGTQATNLQGIWNESRRPPWSSNYTLNINAQMNYWMAESCNLSECHLPLMDLIEELAENGCRTAANNYGTRGWCAHHNTDIWRQSEAVGGPATDDGCVNYAFWPQGGSWLVHHIWEHYEYTGDLQFLNQYKDVIKGAGEFLLDYATERDGQIIISPSISPENTYFIDGEPISVCENSAMDLGMMKDVMEICIQMCDLLSIESEFQDECKVALKKIPEYSIGSKGQILEWDKEYEEVEPFHRHLSHLYAFYPGNSINPVDTPEHVDAVKRTMILRSDDATGWGIAWKINIWARLGDGEHTKKVLDYMLRYVASDSSNKGGGGVYPNLLGAHPPYQIDGNFGATAGIAEMLLQDHMNEIVLLPALPSAWNNGQVSGLCAKGGLRANLKWEEGNLSSAVVVADRANRFCIIYKEKKWEIDLEKGEEFKII